MSRVPIMLSDEQKEFIKKHHENKSSVVAISRAYHARFGVVLTPQRIQSILPKLLEGRRKDVQDIKNKLSSHNEQLEHVRQLLLNRLEEDGVSNHDLVNLSKELRQNIVSSQQIASMNDESGNAQYILVYGDQIQRTSLEADTTDVESTLIGEEDA